MSVATAQSMLFSSSSEPSIDSSRDALCAFWQQAMLLRLPPTERAERAERKSVENAADLYRRFFQPVSAARESVNFELPVVEPAAAHTPVIHAPVIERPTAGPAALESITLVQRLKQGLSKTRQKFSLAQLFASKSANTNALLAELETQLLMADVGVAVTDKLLSAVRQQLVHASKNTHAPKKQSQANADQAVGQVVKNLLRQAMVDILARPQADPFALQHALQPRPAPFVLLMVGVNGVGKTTTLGKLAKQLVDQGQQVLLAAGDTFRAAAIEQLQAWGERHHVPVVAQQAGADAAAVIFDAVSRAKARHIDVVLADTAGRLHNKAHLMDELSKVVRVIKKQDASAPHAILLVVDATTGQNAIAQAKVFQQLIGVTGIVLTKLDGTAKGGIAFALVDQLQLPICYVGVGEQVEDLRPFVASDFVDALLDFEKVDVE